MSDAELKSYLANSMLYQMGKMAGVCAAKFPDLTAEILTQTTIFNIKTKALQKRSEEVAKRAFERASPGEGTTRLYQQEESEAEEALRTVTLSREACMNVSSGLEGMSYNPEETVTGLIDGMFRQARIKVRQCG